MLRKILAFCLGLGMAAHAHPYVNEELVYNQVTPASTSFPIMRASADGSNPVQLTDGKFLDLDPSWTRDHRSILFSHFEPGPGRWQLCTMDREGKHRRVLCDIETDKPIEVSRPVASPALDWIAFSERIYDKPSRTQVFLVRSNGQQLHPVGPQGATHPVWSHDGKKLWFQVVTPREPFRAGESPEVTLHSIDVDGKNQQAYPYQGEPVMKSFDLAPVGKKILFEGINHGGMDWLSNFYQLEPGKTPEALGLESHDVNVNVQWVGANRMVFNRRGGSDEWSIFSSDLQGGSLVKLLQGGFLGGELTEHNTGLHHLIYSRLTQQK